MRLLGQEEAALHDIKPLDKVRWHAILAPTCLVRMVEKMERHVQLYIGTVLGNSSGSGSILPR